jgi:cytochrome b
VSSAVIAGDKRKAFAQGSASDEAIHNPIGTLDCFASLAMTMEVVVMPGLVPGMTE